MPSTCNKLYITSLEVKHFRCFTHKVLAFEKPIVIFHGMNGKGKTSLLEALHYAAYLRSFKNITSKDIAQFGTDNFFIKIGLLEANNNEPLARSLQVGFSDQTKLVKIDQQTVTSYKELLAYYRAVSVTEDDLELVQQGPKVRRFFLDQLIVMIQPSLSQLFKDLRAIVERRNKFFIQQKGDKEEYLVWTEQLWKTSYAIQQERLGLLGKLEQIASQLLEQFFGPEIDFLLQYQAKRLLHTTMEEFIIHNPTLYDQERRASRSLFGAHLDDFSITFEQKKSRLFLSRGQQKLVTLLLKVAQVKLLQTIEHDSGVILLLDDFMTDFDATKVAQLLATLRQMNTQIFITCPILEGGISHYLSPDEAQVIAIE